MKPLEGRFFGKNGQRLKLNECGTNLASAARPMCFFPSREGSGHFTPPRDNSYVGVGTNHMSRSSTH
jgi:hypothetical protein